MTQNGAIATTTLGAAIESVGKSVNHLHDELRATCVEAKMADPNPYINYYMSSFLTQLSNVYALAAMDRLDAILLDHQLKERENA